MSVVNRIKCLPFVQIFLSAWLWGAVIGCVQQQAQAPPVLPDCPPDLTEKLAALTDQNEGLEEDLSSNQAKIDGLKREVANLEIRMLQKEALVIELQRRTGSQQ